MDNTPVDIKDLRREYLHDGLSRDSLLDNPLAQLKLWLKQAINAKLTDPTAMTLATVDANGQASQRIVLLKHADEKGLVFYTNFHSKKGQDIDQNAKVSLHFAWLPLDRQIKIQGTATKINQQASYEYFKSRPRDSQLGAWASKQSHIIESRQTLENDFANLQKRFAQNAIPLPEFWGGYCVTVSHYEFWQGRANRLHDCFSFQLQSNDTWKIDRLAP